MPLSWHDRFAAAVVRFRVAILLSLVVVTGAMAVPLSQLRIGYSVESFLSSEDPLLQEAAAHYAEFAVPDNLLLFCYPEPDPYSIDAQERLEDVDRALRRLDGVERVLTVASAPGIGRGHGERLRSRVNGSHTWRNLLVSKDEDALGGVVVLNRDEAGVNERDDLFRRLLALPELQDLDIRLAGIPYHRSMKIAMIRDDQRLFIPLSAAITSILLFWFVPHLAMALLCMAVVPFTLVATLGTMSLCGIDVTMLTSTLPVLLMCMAVAGGVHVVGRFIEERNRDLQPRDAAAHTLSRLLFPCFLTSLTTAIGFLTLTFTSLPDLRDLGYFAALGVGYAYVFTILVMPAVLSMVKTRPARLRFDLPVALIRLSVLTAMARPARVLVPAGVLLLAAGYQATNVERDYHLRGDLWDDSELAQSLAYYEQRFVSMTPSEVVVKSETGFDEPRVQAQLGQLITWLESMPPVDRSLSVLDLTRDDMPIWLVRGTGGLGGLLSKDGRTARVLVFQADVGGRYLRAFSEEVARKGEEFPDLEVHAAGVQIIATTLIDRLTGVLSRSFLGSLAVIFCLIWWHFGSARLGLIAMVPNLFPLVMNLAFMSLVGMELRPLTVISFCVAFGLAVDDTVHLLARFREERRAGRGRDQALVMMLQTAGRPVVVTTLLLLVGFTVILTSGFRGTYQFGTLVSLALTGSLLGALFLMPSLLRATKVPIDSVSPSPDREPVSPAASLPRT